MTHINSVNKMNRMNGMVDPFLGRVLNAGGDLALSSWGTYRMLFAPPLTGSTRDWLARRRASAAFFQARRRVPAYGDFLREHGALDVADWADVPAMDKAGYIARWPIEALCLDGRLPTRGAVIDESSGSSGAASNWVRGEAERRAARKLMQLSSRSSFGEESFILLNAFALGPWATGMNVSMALVDRCVLKSIGPDVDKVVATLKLLGPKYPYVIAGYPPFLKTLIDTADIDWREYNVRAVVGGEGMSEPLRAALNRCFRSTISSFGASDLEINLAVETPFSIALRQAIDAKPALGHDLFGREALPMIFQYDPLNCLDRVGRRAQSAVHDQPPGERVAACSLQHSRSRHRAFARAGGRCVARPRRAARVRRRPHTAPVALPLGTSGQLGRLLRLQDHAGRHPAGRAPRCLRSPP